MMDTLGSSIQAKFKDVSVPRSLSIASSSRIITMTYLHGESIANILSKGARACVSTAVRNSFATTLLQIYGHQIFDVGIFHSDPHPGNLLLSNSGSLSLLDFGQVKVLSTHVRAVFAQLIVSMSRSSPEAGSYLEKLGIKIDNCTPKLKSTIAYILFDTRMDLPEARMNPFENSLPVELRRLRLSTIPQDVFMLVRVVSLLRGLLSAFEVDVHSRHIWAPYAVNFLKRTNVKVESMSLLTSTHVVDEENQMRDLSIWLGSHDLPHAKRQLTPLGLANIWDVQGLAKACSTYQPAKLNRILCGFTALEQNMLKSMIIHEKYSVV